MIQDIYFIISKVLFIPKSIVKHNIMKQIKASESDVLDGEEINVRFIPKSVIHKCLNEMVEDKVINYIHTDGAKGLYWVGK